MKNFTYFRPTTVDAAVGLLRDYRAAHAVEERLAVLLDRAIAVPAPVHRARVVEATKALRGHRAIPPVCRPGSTVPLRAGAAHRPTAATRRAWALKSARDPP